MASEREIWGFSTCPGETQRPAAGKSGIMFRYDIICYVALALNCSTASAQSEPPAARPNQLIEGGVGVRPAPPSLGGGQSAKQHMGPTGKPCLTVSGEAHSQAVNPRIFEHAVTASNSCSQVIKLFVCYRGSDRCVPMTVPSYSRQTTILGIEPAMMAFRFEYWERFP